MAARRKSTVFRITGFLTDQPDDTLQGALKAVISDSLSEAERSGIEVRTTILPSCYDSERERVALVEFRGGVPEFLSELVQNPLGDWQIEMGDIDINFDCHFHGFTQLYAPTPGDPITADIIAITGLDGHAYGSWRGKGNLGRMWLRDFLSKDLPHCRTMIYGYNSKLSSHGIDTILDYSREFMEEIKKVRATRELRERPLFFIAHSFGGIILAHCLIRAVQITEDDHPTIASLHRATYGILLFATPHKGLVIDDIQKMLAGCENHTRSALLQQISHKSDLLISQLVDFKNLIRDRKVVSFYETGQTKQLEFDIESRRWRRTGNFVTAVDTDSALLQLPDHTEEKIPLCADHSTIVKFDTKHAQGYKSALDKLKRFERDAPRVVGARFGTRFDPEPPYNRPCSITVVSRFPNHLDVFTCGRLGRVYTSWWDNGGNWEPGPDNWKDLYGAFTPGRRVSAVSRHSKQLDLFICHSDGCVYTAWWYGEYVDWWSTRGVFGPGRWLVIGDKNDFPVSADVTAVTPNRGRLDLFVCGRDGKVQRSWWTKDGSWRKWEVVGNHSFEPASVVTALVQHPDKIHLFVLGTDGSVYTVSWNIMTEGPMEWQQLCGRPHSSLPKKGRVAAVARGQHRLDLFVCGQDGNVYTQWYDSAAGWGTGDWQLLGSPSGPTAGRFSPGSKVAAVARGSEQLDIFVCDSSGCVYTKHCELDRGWAVEWRWLGKPDRGTAPNGADVEAVARAYDGSIVDLFVCRNGAPESTFWWKTWNPSTLESESQDEWRLIGKQHLSD